MEAFERGLCKEKIERLEAENKRLREAGDGLAKGISDFDDWADSTHYNPHSPFGLRLLGLRQNVKDWREACDE